MPKQLPFSEVDEDEKTTIESGWEEEPSTTVEQSEIANQLRAELPPRRTITSVTSTNAGPLNSAVDELTVDDQAGNALMSLMTPVTSPARVVITQGNETGAALEIRPGKTYTIGRGVDNDIVLTDIAVSRKHFDLRYEHGQWLLIDRGSGNGTLVNGSLEDQPFALASGDAIEIGNTTFRFDQANGVPRPRPSEIEDGGMMGDEEDEPSTVAGKPMRPEPPPEGFSPPQHQHHYVPPVRPPTLPPPTPLRTRAPSGAPPPQPMAPPQQQYQPPAPRPPSRPATLMGPQEQQQLLPYNHGQPLPGMMPTTLPGQGMPMSPHQPQILGGQPQGNAYGYAEIPPYLINANGSREAPATALVHPTPYGGMPAAAAPYAAVPTPTLSRRTKMILGGIALTALAALLTVAVVRSGHSDPSTAETADKSAAPKPTVESIKEPTITPVSPRTVETVAPKKDPPKEIPKIAETPKDLPKLDPPKLDPPKLAETPKKDPPKKDPPKLAETPKKDPPKKDPPKLTEAPKKEPPPKKEESKREVVKKDPPPKKEPLPKKEPRVAVVEQPPTQGTPKIVDTSSAKAKASQQFAAKQFPAAIATLKSAASSTSGDDQKELQQQARIYDQFARNYNMGMGPATPPTDAYTSLIKARNFDSAGVFKGEVETKLGEVAQRAAVTFMTKSQFIDAFSAVRTTESLAGANSTTKLVRSKLEQQAGELYQAASKDMPSEAAKEKLKTVTKMVESKSPWYQKASKLLASS